MYIPGTYVVDGYTSAELNVVFSWYHVPAIIVVTHFAPASALVSMDAVIETTPLFFCKADSLEDLFLPRPKSVILSS